ncbi:MAG: M18 family aminopeptidase [Tissierellia bacterium]|nr:M18 family aminopeptidase [Tissierellia bacterium]
MQKEFIKDLLDFIDSSPCNFLAIENAKKRLLESGFIHLKENERWNLEKNKAYFLTRGASSIIAFTVGDDLEDGFNMIGSHSDSPSFKIKANPEIINEGMLTFNTEAYGGMIVSTWLDRTLSLCGRVVIEEDEKLIEKNIMIDKDLLSIPNLAIHLNREINNGYSYNLQDEIKPIVKTIDDKFVKKNFLLEELSSYLEVKKSSIRDFELSLYDRQKGSIIGFDEEFFQVGRIDNLAMAHASIEAIRKADRTKFNLVIINDNEEIGSNTRRGADSPYLKDVLKRIAYNLGYDFESYQIAINNSFMISADQAHAIHPNYTNKFDPTNRAYINKGPVIKIANNGAYTSDSHSIAKFEKLAKDVGVKVQKFYNRSDKRGGSTIGPITQTQTGIKSIDVGNPIFAMHSIREIGGVYDHYDMYKIFEKFMGGK